MIDHYLDHFIIVGPPESRICGHGLDLLVRWCKDLGVPLALDKLEGQTDCITFLSIEIDTAAGVLRLPADKLARMRVVSQQWSSRRACERRELESLIGTLQHACRVIKPGRSFLRQMISLLHIPQRPHHHVRLNKHFRGCLHYTGMGSQCSLRVHHHHSTSCQVPLANGDVGPGAKPAGSSFSCHYQPIGTIFPFWSSGFAVLLASCAV